MCQASKPAGLTDEQWEVVRVARAGSYSDEGARKAIQKLCSVVLELGTGKQSGSDSDMPEGFPWSPAEVLALPRKQRSFLLKQASEVAALRAELAEAKAEAAAQRASRGCPECGFPPAAERLKAEVECPDCAALRAELAEAKVDRVLAALKPEREGE